MRVIKDTKAPTWSDVSTSNGTVYPVKDNYKDSTQLSARVSENVSDAKVEIRKAGGPIVRTLQLGRIDAGRVRATWNGRKSNGDIAPKGKYTFRFIGTDKGGLVGKSNDKVVNVSDKELVKKDVTKTVSALGSGLGDYSGGCSRVVVMRSLDGYARDWKNGLQWQSNFRRSCTGVAGVAMSAHVAKTEQAIRYGSFQISTYGGGVTEERWSGKDLVREEERDDRRSAGARDRAGVAQR